MKDKMQFSAPCLFGLESVLKFEISRAGGENIEAHNGKVTFTGDERVLAKSSLWLRTAERIGIVLASFKATTFTELFDGVMEIPFEDYIGEFDQFPVKGWSIDSKLASVPSCQSIIKKAAVKRLGSVYNREIFPETGTLYQISFSLHKDEAVIMLDTTGDPLYKRGYRQQGNLAPIRETLAAGIIDFARVSENDAVYDPLCGSGTMIIEAAQRALNIAPGLNRKFSAEDWSVANKAVWEEERALARGAINKDVKFKGYGFDIDGDIIKVARENARQAGVGEYIEFKQQDIKDFKPVAPAIIVCNPPYGERMMDNTEVHRLYKTMGKVMPKAKDVKYYIIAPPEDFEPAFGRKADRRRKLYNGMLPCQLYMYFR